MTEPRHPARLIGCRSGCHRVGETGQPQGLQLHAIKLLAAEIRRIDGVRIDQHRSDASAAEHGGSERAGQTPACDDNIDVPQLGLPKPVCLRRKSSKNNKARCAIPAGRGRYRGIAVKLRAAGDHGE